MSAPSNRDLSMACAWATAMVVAVAITDSVLLRAVLCVPMVFVIAGHTILRAIGIRTTSLAQHVAFAVGASLAAGIAGGLVLNGIDILTPLGWAIWFWIVTIAASLIAVERGENSELPSWPRPAGIRPWHGVAFAAAVLISTGAYALAVRDESSQQQFKYVELWMLPPANGGAAHLAVGIRNAEAKTQRFDLEITLDDQPLAVFRSLALAPGDTWTREIPVSIATTAQKAKARLYRSDDNRLYRSVSALVPSG